MITGLNTDIKYQGKIYHVQTEDSGRNHPTITTILFQGGAILATRKTSYADRVQSENLPALVKELMNEQHRKVVQELETGRFAPSAGPPDEISRPKSQEKPSDGRAVSAPGAKKSLDDMILDYLSAREETKKP